MCLSDKQCEGLSEYMIELGLTHPLDLIESGLPGSDLSMVRRALVLLPDSEVPSIAPEGEIDRYLECGRIAKVDKHQLMDVVNGHFQTLSLRSFDAHCHDKAHDDEESGDEVVVSLLDDMDENDWYGLPTH